jgi:hypothetical protein
MPIIYIYIYIHIYIYIATQEAEFRRIVVLETPSRKNPSQKRAGRVT